MSEFWCNLMQLKEISPKFSQVCLQIQSKFTKIQPIFPKINHFPPNLRPNSRSFLAQIRAEKQSRNACLCFVNNHSNWEPKSRSKRATFRAEKVLQMEILAMNEWRIFATKKHENGPNFSAHFFRSPLFAIISNNREQQL